MNKRIDILLEQIGSDIPKINPQLNTKIYNKAIESESVKNIPFFKKPLIIAFSSFLGLFIVLYLVINMSGLLLFDKGSFDKNHDTNEDVQLGNPSFDSMFVPNLSPTEQTTVFIDYHYTIYTDEFDIVTLIINNKIDYQKIYIKAYNLNIEEIRLNNGDVEINEVYISKVKFFEIVFDNTNTNIHYIDICFKKDTFTDILENQEVLNINFIMYIDEIDKSKGYGYDFKNNKIFDLREGNYL